MMLECRFLEAFVNRIYDQVGKTRVFICFPLLWLLSFWIERRSRLLCSFVCTIFHVDCINCEWFSLLSIITLAFIWGLVLFFRNYTFHSKQTLFQLSDRTLPSCRSVWIDIVPSCLFFVWTFKGCLEQHTCWALFRQRSRCWVFCCFKQNVWTIFRPHPQIIGWVSHRVQLSLFLACEVQYSTFH